jgi:ankyrin repeat protein
MQLLLDAGSTASMELQDSQGLTPLSWAAYNGHARAVHLLLLRARQIHWQQQQQQQEPEAQHAHHEQHQQPQQQQEQQQQQQQQQEEAAAEGQEDPFDLGPAVAGGGSAFSEATLRTAATAASRHGHLHVFANLLMEIAASYGLSQASPEQVRDLIQEPAAPAPTDTALAVIAQCLSDRRWLERQLQQLQQQRQALQREREELDALRMGVQHLIVQGGGGEQGAACGSRPAEQPVGCR